MKTYHYILLGIGGLAVLSAGGYVVKTQLLDKKMVSKAVNSDKLKSLNPVVKDRLQMLVAYAIKQGYKVTITSTNRTFAEQEALNNNNSKNAKPGRSMHNFGIAQDITLDKDGKHYGKTTQRADWESTGIPAYAKKIGVFWGADIPGYYDPVHFQYSKGLDINELTALKTKQNVEGNQVKIPLKNRFIFKDKNLLKA
jgi:hypothetical protein